MTDKQSRDEQDAAAAPGPEQAVDRTSGPNSRPPSSSQTTGPRASFSAIGLPVTEPTAATGAVSPRPVAEVRPTGSPLAPPAPPAPPVAPTQRLVPPTQPPAPTQRLAAPAQRLTAPAQRPAAPMQSRPFSLTAAQPLQPHPAVAPPVEVPKKRKGRTAGFALLALLTIGASGAVSYFVANEVSNDSATATPVSLPTAASAPSDTATAPSVETLDVEIIADEPFAAAAEIIRPSVVQLNLGTGLGTGVIINENGTILTAAHVVGDATEVSVTFFDGSSAEGVVVGAHVETDVAVVQVDPTGRDLTVATLASGEDVRVGQIAVAVGSPFGFDQTVTAGIVSAVDRIVNGVSMVQTDASINPGNSGGPLINLNGEVIGINDLIFTESGSSAGVGFAISIDLAEIIADQIVQGVEPQIALLGVSTTAAPNGGRGALVDSVSPGSAAEEAGLQPGDVVLDLDGLAIRGSSDLRAGIIDQAPGSEVVIGVLRDGESVDLTAVLGSTG